MSDQQDQVLRTTGIFEFDQETHIYAWWLVFGDGADFLAALYKPKRDEPRIRFTYRFKYHAGPEHFDSNDVIRSYHADFRGETPEEARQSVERVVLTLAHDWETDVEEIEVNGGVDLAVQKLTAHRAVKSRDVPEAECSKTEHSREPSHSSECDFCGSPKIRWAYPADDFTIGAVVGITPKEGAVPKVLQPIGSSGPWAACDECAAFIERDDYGALRARALEQNAASGLLEPSTARVLLTTLHAGFKKHRTGPRMEIA